MTYTQLSPTATPGMRYLFPEEAPIAHGGGTFGLRPFKRFEEKMQAIELKAKILKDDEEVLEIIRIILPYL